MLFFAVEGWLLLHHYSIFFVYGRLDTGHKGEELNAVGGADDDLPYIFHKPRKFGGKLFRISGDENSRRNGHYY